MDYLSLFYILEKNYNNNLKYSIYTVRYNIIIYKFINSRIYDCENTNLNTFFKTLYLSSPL